MQDSFDSRKILVTDNKARNHLTAFHANEGIERDLTWHDYTTCRDITDDGRTILIEEGGISDGIPYLSYIRQIDGSAMKLIGNGAPIAFSPDEKHALVRIPSPHNHLTLINIDTKEVKVLETDSEKLLIYQEFAYFFPNGKQILFAAAKLNSGTKIYIQNIDGGSLECLLPNEEGLSMESHRPISPDSEYIVLKNNENKLLLYRISDGTFSPLKNLDEEFSLVRWTGDGQSLFIQRRRELPAVIYKYDIAVGTMEKFLQLMPRDAVGVNEISTIKLTPDGRTYAYRYLRQSSDLYLMEDLV